MSNQLHIVAFDVPYPPNYGGVIEVFYKVKALYEAGIKVQLHCFQYGRKKAVILEQYCEKVHYYPRLKAYQSAFFKKPYIVASRQSDELLQHLIEQSFPILFEGLHCCFYLSHPDLKKRLKIVRMHNIEWEYYAHLALAEHNFFKKVYFKIESKRLQHFENILYFADYTLGISPKETEYLKKRFKNVVYLPAFHGNHTVSTKTGSGDYALYHGNLEVMENHQAALFLVNEVFSDLPFSLVIAGNNPKQELIERVAEMSNMSLIHRPDNAEMERLIADAHVHVLPTFQATGIKLKLLNALYKGRFCVVNNEMVQQTGLENLCEIANTPLEYRQMVGQVFKKEFTLADLEARQKVLKTGFSDAQNVQGMLNLLKKH